MPNPEELLRCDLLIQPGRVCVVRTHRTEEHDPLAESDMLYDVEVTTAPATNLQCAWFGYDPAEAQTVHEKFVSAIIHGARTGREGLDATRPRRDAQALFAHRIAGIREGLSGRLPVS